MILACVGQKGGIGKSTIAIALAAEGMTRGLSAHGPPRRPSTSTSRPRWSPWITRCTGPVSSITSWALAETLELVSKAQTLRPELRAAIVINKQTRTALGRGVREALATTGVPVLATELHSRVAYREAINLGQGVAQCEPGSAAALEVRKLFEEILSGDEPHAQAQAKAKRRKPAQAAAQRRTAR